MRCITSVCPVCSRNVCESCEIQRCEEGFHACPCGARLAGCSSILDDED